MHYIFNILTENSYNVSHPLFPENESPFMSVSGPDGYERDFTVFGKTRHMDTLDMSIILERTILSEYIELKKLKYDGTELEYALYVSDNLLASVCVINNEISDVYVEDVTDGSLDRCIYAVIDDLTEYIEVSVDIENTEIQVLKIFARFGFELSSMFGVACIYKKKLVEEIEL